VTLNTASFSNEPIGRVMNKISRMFLANLHKNMDQLDLKRSYYPLLLIEASHGSITQQELAEKLSCDKVQVVRIINYLSSKGYVTRIKDQHDRRKFNLFISEKAKKSLPDIKKAMEATTRIALEQIPVAEIYQLYKTLEKIEKNLSVSNNCQ
jgi:DNA-binding MarR family transcriptional regulator